MSDIDLVRLNFNPQTLLALNLILGLVMFGVSLELRPADFRAALAKRGLREMRFRFDFEGSKVIYNV